MKTRLMAAVMGVAVCVLAVFAADEITTMQQLSVNKGYLTVSKGVDSKSTMQGNAYDQKVTQFDTNTANTIAVSSSITTAGVAFIRNLTTNGNAVVSATFELYPGETLMGRLLTSTVTVYCKTTGVVGYPYTTTEITGGTTNVYTNWPSATVNVESIILAQ